MYPADSIRRRGLPTRPAPRHGAAMDASPEFPRQSRVPVFNMPGVGDALDRRAHGDPGRARVPAAGDLGHPPRAGPGAGPGPLDAVVRSRSGLGGDSRSRRFGRSRHAGGPRGVRPLHRRRARAPALELGHLRVPARLVDARDLQQRVARRLRFTGGPPLRRLALRADRACRNRGRRSAAPADRSPECRPAGRRLGGDLGPDGGRRPVRVPAAGLRLRRSALAIARRAAPSRRFPNSCATGRRSPSWRSGWSPTCCSASSARRWSGKAPRSPGTRISAASSWAS